MRGHLQQRSRDTWRLKLYVGRSADGRKRYGRRVQAVVLGALAAALPMMAIMVRLASQPTGVV